MTHNPLQISAQCFSQVAPSAPTIRHVIRSVPSLRAIQVATFGAAELDLWEGDIGHDVKKSMAAWPRRISLTGLSRENPLTSRHNGQKHFKGMTTVARKLKHPTEPAKFGLRATDRVTEGLLNHEQN